MNGLEAIKFMEQGKMVQNELCIYKVENGEVLFKNKLYKDDVFLKSREFDFTSNYEEYTESKPSTGWGRTEHLECSSGFYVITECDVLAERISYNHVLNKKCYENANYFSKKEKAEEINFKQTLFRKLQRFSDENEGYKIDWNDFKQPKYSIYYNRRTNEISVTSCKYISEPFKVYFLSEETANKAIELFRDELIKYFNM